MRICWTRMGIVAAFLLMGLRVPQGHAGVERTIRFAPGASSAVVKGTVVRGERDVYTVSARRGQRMQVSIRSVERNAVFQIYPAPPHDDDDCQADEDGHDDEGDGDGLPGADDGDDATAWNGTLPTTCTYRIVVGGTRGNATYTLKVGIR